MKRGVNYGGGQSSLGYLFDADEQPPPPSAVTPPVQPPYGTDIMPEKPPAHDESNSEKKTEKSVSNNYPRPQGQNTGNLITDRPSTKVKSVPGGGSSLGYLFGDK